MWKFIPVLIISFFFYGGNFAYANHAATSSLHINFIDAQGDDVQVNIDFDMSQINNTSIEADEFTQTSGIGLAPNDFLPGQNFAFGCNFPPTTQCFLPNRTYLWRFTATNQTASFTTNENARPSFFPPEENNNATTTSIYIEERDKIIIFTLLYLVFLLSLGTTIFVFKPLIYDRK